MGMIRIKWPHEQFKGFHFHWEPNVKSGDTAIQIFPNGAVVEIDGPFNQPFDNTLVTELRDEINELEAKLKQRTNELCAAEANANRFYGNIEGWQQRVKDLEARCEDLSSKLRVSATNLETATLRGTVDTAGMQINKQVIDSLRDENKQLKESVEILERENGRLQTIVYQKKAADIFNSDYDDWRQLVKERAYELDPECWVSYSGKPRVFKQQIEVRRKAALEKAEKALTMEANYRYVS